MARRKSTASSSSKPLTLGDVLPDDLKSQYTADVLNTSLHDALLIAKYDMAPSQKMSVYTIQTIRHIYSMYRSGVDKDSGSAYWNKSETENAAYWSKQQS